MAEWKIGEVVLQGYLLKIICIEDAETLLEDFEERRYQLVLLKQGTAILNVNGKSIAVTAPGILCLSDRDKVKWMNPKNEYEMNIICFHPSVVNHLFDCDNVASGDLNADWTTSVIQDRYLLYPFFERSVPYGGIFQAEAITFHRILQLFEKLQQQLRGEVDTFWPCRSRSFLIEILIILQMMDSDNLVPEELLELNGSNSEMDAVLEYIHSNYSAKISIELLTKQFHMNRNALNQRFSELTGCTPISYLIQHRLKVAESLLINTRIPVYEICERVGFSELSNFMKSFKKKYGQTPANYRTMYTTMID